MQWNIHLSLRPTNPAALWSQMLSGGVRPHQAGPQAGQRGTVGSDIARVSTHRPSVHDPSGWKERSGKLAAAFLLLATPEGSGVEAQWGESLGDVSWSNTVQVSSCCLEMTILR